MLIKTQKRVECRLKQKNRKKNHTEFREKKEKKSTVEKLNKILIK